MVTAGEMETELASVLADPMFVRSPALARLLKYLVDAAISGRGKTLKSFSVAVDGMGKSPDLDSQVDTYARVLVTRLRKALDVFYATAGAQHSNRLWIESGSYEVQLIANGPSVPERAAPPRRTWWRGLAVAVAAFACVIVATVAVVQWRENRHAETQIWRTSNFPFVDVTVVDEAGTSDRRELAHQMRQSILGNLDNYEGVRIAYNPSRAAEYSIVVTLRKSEGRSTEYIEVVDRNINRLIWSESNEMTFNNSDVELSSDKFLAKSLFIITHPSGVIHSNERKRKYSIGTPYGCWLQFAGMLQNNSTIGISSLPQCAKDWYAAAPNHPLAAALYGWTLTDESATRLTASGRDEAIQKAISVLEAARLMNPNSPLLQVSTMRAYAYAGDALAVRKSAIQALKLNPDNLDIVGVVGLMRVLQNDPQGEVLLNKAIEEHFNPPPWYFVGIFVAAMMRDDTAGAGRALFRLRELQHSLPVLPILSAAYEGRTGHPEMARAQWERAMAIQPILRVAPQNFLSRLPIAPEVRSRLEAWLGPVIGSKRI